MKKFCLCVLAALAIFACQKGEKPQASPSGAEVAQTEISAADEATSAEGLQENEERFDLIESYEYDEMGNVIHKTTVDEEIWYEYDGRGNKTMQKNNKGELRLYEYDEKGRRTKRTVTREGVDEPSVLLKEYDSQGRLSKETSSRGFVFFYEYDENGRISRSGIEGMNFSEFKYDEKGNEIYVKEVDGGRNGKETWKEYDANGLLVHSRSSDGEEIFYKYDDKKGLIYKKQISPTQRDGISVSFETEFFYKNEYDEKGRIVSVSQRFNSL